MQPGFLQSDLLPPGSKRKHFEALLTLTSRQALVVLFSASLLWANLYANTMTIFF